MWGVGRSVGRGEGNVEKYGEVWKNVGGGVEKCVWVWGKVWVVWEIMGSCGEVCTGCGERCGKCVGVGRGEECGQRCGVWEDVGRGLGSVKKCGER